MNAYERLQEEACEDGIEVVDYTFESDRIKGLYCDGVVAIKKDMDSTQKACTLAEEMGHHHTPDCFLRKIQCHHSATVIHGSDRVIRSR